MLLPNSAGTWVGNNGFRLMPSDPFAEPARVTVMAAAGGHLASIAYWWEHPDDGPQDGLVVVGPADDGGSLVAMWGDSWHQKPAPMMLSGSRDSAGTTLELEGEWGGGWGWRVTFDATEAGSLRMQMDNVIPAEHATAEIAPGPYPVMVMHAGRA